MINTIDLAKLRNAEFLQFGTFLSEFVVASDPVALNIAPQHTAFKAKLDETAGLFKVEKSSPFTQELILFDVRRDKAISGIAGVIDSYGNHFDTPTLQATSLLADNLNIYGTGIARLNTQEETSTIKAIVHDWETKPELTAAIAKLFLTSWVAELKAANLLYEQKFFERTQEYGAANPETLKQKREETMAAYYVLRDFINANLILHPSAAFTALENGINALIEQYNTLIATHANDPEPAAVVPQAIN